MTPQSYRELGVVLEKMQGRGNRDAYIAARIGKLVIELTKDIDLYPLGAEAGPGSFRDPIKPAAPYPPGKRPAPT